MLLILGHLNVLEYYWHRMMHLPWCYRRMHKLHHFYKSPVPFDDMFIHPVEGRCLQILTRVVTLTGPSLLAALGFYIILSTVPLIYRVHIAAFAGYMIVAGSHEWNHVPQAE
jgi:sterol desaturase/sphingolipid hydroxylase (fatty acid hydroxylase superfamily)